MDNSSESVLDGFRRWRAALVCAVVLAPALTSVADEGEPNESLARAGTAPLPAPPTEAGRAWGVDVFGTIGILTGQPQTDFYQATGEEAGLEAHLMVWRWLGVEAEAQYASFGSTGSGPGGNVFLPAGGLRFEPRRSLDGTSYYLSAHAGDAFTGPLNRFGFDAAVGAEWNFGLVQVGPVLRFVDVVSHPAAGEIGGDARIILVGLSIGLGVKHQAPVLRRPEPAAAAPRPTLGFLRGRVGDPDGQALQGTLVVTPEDDDGETQTLAAAPDFRTLRHPGHYHVEASAPGHLSSGEDVTIEAGEIVTCDFTLPLIPQAAPAAVLTETEIEVNQTIEFELDSAVLLENSHAILDQVAEILREHPELRICIDGHTDDQGTSAYNQRLSEERAESVRSYLFGAGIPADRLETRGYGWTRPIASNSTEDGQARNRRVQFEILSSVQGADE